MHSTYGCLRMDSAVKIIEKEVNLKLKLSMHFVTVNSKMYAKMLKGAATHGFAALRDID